jgi:hypothetical protein
LAVAISEAIIQPFARRWVEQFVASVARWIDGRSSGGARRAPVAAAAGNSAADILKGRFSPARFSSR